MTDPADEAPASLDEELVDVLGQAIWQVVREEKEGLRTQFGARLIARALIPIIDAQIFKDTRPYCDFELVAREAEIARLREALSELVKAWGALTEGYYSNAIIQQWLVKDMKPAIDKARTALGEQP